MRTKVREEKKCKRITELLYGSARRVRVRVEAATLSFSFLMNAKAIKWEKKEDKAL